MQAFLWPGKLIWEKNWSGHDLYYLCEYEHITRHFQRASGWGGMPVIHNL